MFPFNPFPVAPPNGNTGYPVAADASTFLVAAGVSGVATADIERCLRAAIQEWEKRTGYRPFLAQLDESERTFRGESWGSEVLDLRGGLVECTGVVSDWLGGGDLTAPSDYRLMPDTAPANGKPYTYIEFRAPVRGLVRVTGRWGYCDVLPEDVRTAILSRSASLCSEGAVRAATIAAGSSETPGGRLRRVSEGDVTREWSETTSVTERRAVFELWEKTWKDAISLYRLVTLI